MKGQGNLFRKPCEEDRVKDLLKNLFAVIDRTWSFKLIEEAYSEYQIEKELEREMEREASMEIEGESDF